VGVDAAMTGKKTRRSCLLWAKEEWLLPFVTGEEEKGEMLLLPGKTDALSPRKGKEGGKKGSS